MPTFTQGARDGEFLFSEAPGDRSRDVATLKAGRIYEPGTLVTAEEVGGVKTGFHVVATDAATTGALVYVRTNAVAAPAKATVINCDAEVVDALLVLGPGVTLAEARTILSLTGIKVRDSI